ncbi:hypothetical protein MettiDRAFT_2628 [Methanolobus tindarius DSM 2278]|uniref:Uncharacterized protein n=1 Tax=Methanolobus tindarius DSM 2278 TaxID=1090322 RepID=W9DR29_METTI|nr:hypothetical protein [Methanolobus tindarius]ETA69134.1 hypothetical protein MettiDRAFT_2628 [Methanolobus tindarius DSM 2278]
MKSINTDSESSSPVAGVSIDSGNQKQLEALGFDYILPVLQETQA